MQAQLAALESAFHQGSADASQALAKWIGKPSVVEIDSLEQLPLEEATDLLPHERRTDLFLLSGDERVAYRRNDSGV